MSQQKPKPRKSAPTTSSYKPPAARWVGEPQKLPLAGIAKVDDDACRFRYQEHAVGKCVGTNLEMVRSAFGEAYEVCATAAYEYHRFAGLVGMNRMRLWNACHQKPEAALGYWFGKKLPSQSTINTIGALLTNWELGFRRGFEPEGKPPVFLRCKAVDPIFDSNARHIARNMIEFAPAFFELSRTERRITLLHEMGHWAGGSLTRPRDERDDLCSGGWRPNMCYRARVVDEDDESFAGGNPWALARAYDNGDDGVLKVLLNNIDNYVCYMWNRWVDRQGNMLV